MESPKHTNIQELYISMRNLGVDNVINMLPKFLAALLVNLNTIPKMHIVVSYQRMSHVPFIAFRVTKQLNNKNEL